MKLKQEKMLSESLKTIDITGFFKKFCIAIRTKIAPGFLKKPGVFLYIGLF